MECGSGDVLDRRDVDVAGLWEARYKNHNTKILKNNNSLQVVLKWQSFCSRWDEILVRSDLIENVIEIKSANTRMIVVVITINNEMITGMSGCAPQCGCSTDKKNLY